MHKLMLSQGNELSKEKAKLLWNTLFPLRKNSVALVRVKETIGGKGYLVPMKVMSISEDVEYPYCGQVLSKGRLYRRIFFFNMSHVKKVLII